jgi:hypothetical protein
VVKGQGKIKRKEKEKKARQQPGIRLCFKQHVCGFGPGLSTNQGAWTLRLARLLYLVRWAFRAMDLVSAE